MNLIQLKTFLVLSDCLNVTETAEKLFCSQPSVSIKIKKLETSLAAVLFERSGNRLRLTEQGKILRQYAEEILRLNNLAREHIHRYGDPDCGKIFLGASHFSGVYLLPPLIAEYRKDAPGVELSLSIQNSRQLIRALENREVDILVMSDRIAFDPRHYHSRTFFPDESVLVVSPDNPLAVKKHCQIRDILRETFLIKPSHSETRKFLAHHLGEAVCSQLSTMEINTLEGIKQCVLNNLGISIISRLAVQPELDSGQLVEIRLENHRFTRGISYIHHKDKLLSPAAERFLRLLDSLDAAA